MYKPTIERGTELTNKQLEEYIEGKRLENTTRLTELYKYYRGKNTGIMSRRPPDSDVPDHKIPVPYGRKIINTMVGYMYKPGLITITAPGNPQGGVEDYSNRLDEIFKKNSEPLKTSKLGKQVSIFGEAYEIHYTTGEPGVEGVKAEPRFAPVDPRNMVLVYDTEIEPTVVMGIRFWKGTKGITHAEVWTDLYMQKYTIEKKSDRRGVSDYVTVKIGGPVPHFYQEVPIAPYYNNDEWDGDFEAVIPLIDAFDLVMTDSMNEFDRFAWAYLLMKEMKTTPEVLRKIKRLRLFENLKETSDIKFLTKEIAEGFIQDLRGAVRQQIHMQSHVPDFTDERFSGDISGAAIKRLLFDFENLAASKQSYFEEGLKTRLRLIGRIEGLKDETSREVAGDMMIQFRRNLPTDLMEAAQTAATMIATTSRRTALTVYPSDLIPDVDEEMEQIATENEQFATVDVDEIDIPREEGEGA